MRKVFTVIMNVIYVSFIALALAVLFSSYSLGGVRLYTVLSGSMEPTLHPGSVIFVLPASDYRVGDVVTRKAADSDVPVTHRITGKATADGRTVYRTKGDANDVADAEAVAPSDIIGAELVSVPWIGYAVNFAKTREGFLLVVIIPAVIIVYEELGTVRREAAALWRKRRSDKVEANVVIDEPTVIATPEPPAFDQVRRHLQRRKIV